MARVHAIKTAFTTGELDPLLRGRVDFKGYRNGAELMRNVLSQPQGGFVRRPGLEYVGKLPYTLTTQSFSGYTVTMPNDVGSTSVGNLTDDDETTKASTTHPGTTDNFIIFQIDFATAAACPDYLDIIGLGVNAAGTPPILTEEVRLQDSDDASSWTTVEHIFSEISENLRDYRLRLNGKRYVRLIRIGTTDAGTNHFEINELYAWNEGTSISAVRLVPFEFSITQTYLLAFTDRNVRVFRDGVRQADVPTSWTSALLSTTDAELGVTSINWEQDLDTLLVVHPDVTPTSITRSGDHDEWQPAAWTLSNIPTKDFGSGAEAVWSTTRGWPVSCTFFQGRLWFGGSKSRPQTIWASKSGDFNDFDTSSTGDDMGIDVTLDSAGVAAIWNIYPGRHLTLFTSSSEWYIPISENEAVTPTNIVARRNSSRGSKRGPRVVEADGGIIFVQRGGKTVREFLFTETELAYSAIPISLLSSHLLTGPVDMALRKAISTDEADYVWVINGDGRMSALCTLRSQDIAGWTSIHTDGEFKAVAALLEESYFAVERSINGADGLYLEKFNTSLQVDAASYDLALSVATGSLAGATHLAGEAVDIILDGAIQEQQTMSGSGGVTFTRDASTSYQVGLPFPDVSLYLDADHVDYGTGMQVMVKTMPVEEALPEGTSVGRKKRIVDCTVKVKDSSHLIVNGNEVAFRAFGSSLLDEAPPVYTGEKKVAGILGWTEEASVTFGQDKSLPLNVLAAAYRVGV